MVMSQRVSGRGDRGEEPASWGPWSHYPTSLWHLKAVAADLVEGAEEHSLGQYAAGDR